MRKQNRQEIKTVDDYNVVVTDIIDCWIEDFSSREGLTREPDEEDFEDFDGEDIGFMYTQKGMGLYDRACDRFFKLGVKLFPDNQNELDIKSSLIIFP